MQGRLVVAAAIFVLINLLVDLYYGALIQGFGSSDCLFAEVRL